jgi:hypothetical protein
MFLSLPSLRHRLVHLSQQIRQIRRRVRVRPRRALVAAAAEPRRRPRAIVRPRRRHRAPSIVRRDPTSAIVLVVPPARARVVDSVSVVVIEIKIIIRSRRCRVARRVARRVAHASTRDAIGVVVASRRVVASRESRTGAPCRVGICGAAGIEITSRRVVQARLARAATRARCARCARRRRWRG